MSAAIPAPAAKADLRDAEFICRPPQSLTETGIIEWTSQNSYTTIFFLYRLFVVETPRYRRKWAGDRAAPQIGTRSSRLSDACYGPSFRSMGEEEVSWSVGSESNDGLGRRLKRWRQLQGLRISDVSARTGLAVSTISKVENGAMSLTYDKLLQLAKGLSIDMAELFHNAGASETTQRPVMARRSVSKPSKDHYVSAGFYEYWYLNTDLSKKMMTPMMGQVHARTLEEFGELVRHPGEEFLMVIEGAIVVHTEFYTPVVLHVGESLYIDSNMGHAYLTLDGQVGRFVVVCAGDDGDGGMESVKRKAELDLASISPTEPAAHGAKPPRSAARGRKTKP